MDALCSIKSHNASFYDVVHLWTICGLFEFSYVGFYQSPAILTIHNFFRQKQVHLSLPHFLPLIQLLLWQFGPVKTSIGQNLIIADSCIAIHLRA